MQKTPKLGILVDREGGFSLAILADGEKDREEILTLYTRIKKNLGEFESGVKRLLSPISVSPPR